MIYSLFVDPEISAWTQDVEDPVDADYSSQVLQDIRQNVLYQKIEQFELASAASRTISFANYASTEWVFIIARVTGTAYLSTTGFDTNGSTAITAKLPMYGTALLPGIGMFSSYNLSTLSIVSQADGTLVELYAAIACPDDDTRYDTNA